MVDIAVSAPLSNLLIHKLASFFLRHPKALMVAIIVYVLSPIDFVPEAVLGPLGFLDDVAIVVFPLLLRIFAKQFGTKDSPAKRPPHDFYDTTAR
jgi:uncharacterized membrane protein YkvA (DUF1232 family)